MNQTNTQLEQSLQPISFIERCLKVDEYHRGGKESTNTDAMTRTCLKVDQDNQESIPIFGRCRSLEQMKTQSDLFTKQETQYTKQSIIHVQSMIYDKLDARIIMKFMKSISVIVDATSTKFLIDNNPDLQLIYKYKVTRNPDIQMEGYKLFVTYWDQVYNEKITLSKNIIEQEKLEENKNVDWQRLYTFIRQQHYEAVLQSEKQIKELEEQQTQQYKEELLIQLQAAGTTKNRYYIQICKIKIFKTLRLRPNENIIIGQHNKSGYIPINRNQQVYYLNNGHRLFHKFSNVQYFQYNGAMNRNYEPETYWQMSQSLQKTQCTVQNQNGIIYQGGIKDSLLHNYGQLALETQSYSGMFAHNMRHGYGEYKETVNTKKYIYRGNFDSDQKSGEFYCGEGVTHHYHKDILYDGGFLNKEPKNNNVKQNEDPSYNILYYNDISINNHQLNTLNFGKRVNETIVDYYLKICNKYYNLEQSNDIKFINIFQSQHTLRSILVPDQYIPNQHQIKKNHGYSKIIIALNHDQNQFLAVVIEKNQIYLFDSQKSDRILLINTIKQLLENKTILEVNKEFTVSQQNNNYDSGIYTSYYIQRIISLQNRSIQTMSEEQQFNVQQGSINRFRAHMRKVILSESLPPFNN